MNKTNHWLLFFGSVWALFLGSCILPESNHIEPDFYLLHLPRHDTNQSIHKGTTSLSFYIREIELPQYLKGNRLTQKSSMEVVKFRDYKRWGEPLADGISRVLGGVYLTDWELWSTLLFPIVEEITVSLRFPYLFLLLRRHFPIKPYWKLILRLSQKMA